MNELKRLYMLQICDSLFPIGAFTLSNGLETYVQHGVVDSPETLAAYLADYLALAPYQELGVAALAVQTALSVTEDEIGVGGPAFDIFAMQHETLYSRLYMS